MTVEEAWAAAVRDTNAVADACQRARTAGTLARARAAAREAAVLAARAERHAAAAREAAVVAQEYARAAERAARVARTMAGQRAEQVGEWEAQAAGH